MKIVPGHLYCCGEEIPGHYWITLLVSGSERVPRTLVGDPLTVMSKCHVFPLSHFH